ncbi:MULTISPECIES: helix-turn-helix domain-containing protein [Arthrobacter]|uniref:DNA-binding protein n=1 Tax=Arthrobacter terricola TaxID=2547396 RepID=A0A4R5K4Q4_9MICC|nr:helix-turn-helix domain-containing protein [Arthrobacter sp. GN70]TDF86881.1 DNA-binding protein [Arthrobacter terricola]
MDDLRLIDIEQLAELLRIGRSHAYRLKREQQWPHVLLGSQIRFTVDDVKAIVAMNHKSPGTAPRGPRVGTGARRERIPKRSST